MKSVSWVDDLLAVAAVLIGTSLSIAVTMAAFSWHEPAPRQLELVEYSVAVQYIVPEHTLMAGPENERTGWKPAESVRGR